jgi:hypothetical protein
MKAEAKKKRTTKRTTKKTTKKETGKELDLPVITQDNGGVKRSKENSQSQREDEIG